MRDRVSASGATLVAVAHLRRGVHPYAVYAFVQEHGAIRVFETAVYWGRIDAKWTINASSAELEQLATAARREFKCSHGTISEPVLGAAFFMWESGQQVTCEGGWFLEEGAFSQLIDDLSKRAVASYGAFPHDRPALP